MVERVSLENFVNIEKSSHRKPLKIIDIVMTASQKKC